MTFYYVVCEDCDLTRIAEREIDAEAIAAAHEKTTDHDCKYTEEES